MYVSFSSTSARGTSGGRDFSFFFFFLDRDFLFSGLACMAKLRDSVVGGGEHFFYSRVHPTQQCLEDEDGIARTGFIPIDAVLETIRNKIHTLFTSSIENHKASTHSQSPHFSQTILQFSSHLIALPIYLPPPTPHLVGQTPLQHAQQKNHPLSKS